MHGHGLLSKANLAAFTRKRRDKAKERLSEHGRLITENGDVSPHMDSLQDIKASIKSAGTLIDLLLAICLLSIALHTLESIRLGVTIVTVVPLPLVP